MRYRDEKKKKKKIWVFGRWEQVIRGTRWMGRRAHLTHSGPCWVRHRLPRISSYLDFFFHPLPCRGLFPNRLRLVRGRERLSCVSGGQPNGPPHSYNTYSTILNLKPMLVYIRRESSAFGTRDLLFNFWPAKFRLLQLVPLDKIVCLIYRLGYHYYATRWTNMEI